MKYLTSNKLYFKLRNVSYCLKLTFFLTPGYFSINWLTGRSQHKNTDENSRLLKDNPQATVDVDEHLKELRLFSSVSIQFAFGIYCWLSNLTWDTSQNINHSSFSLLLYNSRWVKFNNTVLIKRDIKLILLFVIYLIWSIELF